MYGDTPVCYAGLGSVFSHIPRTQSTCWNVFSPVRRIEQPLYARLAEYYETFLARTDLRMFGGSVEYIIGQMDPMDKCQTDVWRLLQPRFTRTSNRAWELPGNASGGSGPVTQGPLPVLCVTPLQTGQGVL